MKISRFCYPAAYLALQFANNEISQYHIGDFCHFGHYDYEGDWASMNPADFSGPYSLDSPYRVVEIKLGSCSPSFLSCNFTPPVFIVENIISGEKKDAIKIETSSEYGRVLISPFAECNRQGQVDTRWWPQVQKIDKVVVTEFLNHVKYQMEEAKKRRTIEMEQRAERERKNQRITDNEINSLIDAVRKNVEDV